MDKCLTPTSLIALHDEQIILVSPKPQHLLPPPPPSPLRSSAEQILLLHLARSTNQRPILVRQDQNVCFQIKNAQKRRVVESFSFVWKRVGDWSDHDRSLLLRMQQKVAVTLSSFSIINMDSPSLFALINFCLFFLND